MTRSRKRHWSRRAIGSDLWWRDLQWLGVARASVESTLALADGDAHQARCFGASAERAATYLRLAIDRPTYAAFMYVSHAWSHANRELKEWIVTQYASLIADGTGEQREAALYSLWVDYFEVPERAAFVFPRLLRQLDDRGPLLACSGPVPWTAKRGAYEAALRDPVLHTALAEGILGSFYDVFGQVDAVEVSAMTPLLTGADRELRQRLHEITTRPIRWLVEAVVTVDERDERWTCSLAPDAAPSYLLYARAEDRPVWFKRSDLVRDGRWFGRTTNYNFPFDAAIRHEVHGKIGEPVTLLGQRAVLFRVEGSVLAGREAIGAIVEAWPPGLHPACR